MRRAIVAGAVLTSSGRNAEHNGLFSHPLSAVYSYAHPAQSARDISATPFSAPPWCEQP